MQVQSDQTSFLWRESAESVSETEPTPEPELTPQDRARSTARAIFKVFKVLERKNVFVSGEIDWMVTSPVESIKHDKSLKL